jgi:uncharacterized membrane protein
MCPTHVSKSASGSPDAEVRLAHARKTGFQVKSLKPFTYSTMHLVVAVSVAFVLTGDWKIALGVGLIEPVVQTFAYMAHEHVWNRADARARLPG